MKTLLLSSAVSAIILAVVPIITAPRPQEMSSIVRQIREPKSEVWPPEHYAYPGAGPMVPTTGVCTAVSRTTTPTDLGTCTVHLSELHHCYGGGPDVSAAFLVVSHGDSEVRILVKHIGSKYAVAQYTNEDAALLLLMVPERHETESPEAVYRILSDYWSGKPNSDDVNRCVTFLVASMASRRS